jgi:hypothetical protein
MKIGKEEEEEPTSGNRSEFEPVDPTLLKNPLDTR